MSDTNILATLRLKTPRWNIKNYVAAIVIPAIFPQQLESSHLFLDNGSHISDRITPLLLVGSY